MCGIVAYVGSAPALDKVLDGLGRLEYRGYDSAGLAVPVGDRLAVIKAAGRLDHLRERVRQGGALFGTAGIGHTRWATHGRPSVRNAHPHVDATGRLALVHNGIVENAALLRDELVAAGVHLVSETDSEVVAHLVGRAYSNGVCAGDLAGAMRSVCRRLTGAFALVALHVDRPGELVAARRGSPLLVGLGDGEAFVASDVAGFLSHTRQAVELGEDDVAVVTARGVAGRASDGVDSGRRAFRVDWDSAQAERGGHATFMEKEIAEQPAAVADTLRGRCGARPVLLGELGFDDDVLRGARKAFVVACGSAFHSGVVAKYAIERWAGLPVEVDLASEFRYREPLLDESTLVIAVSQSGETMDTLAAARHARRRGARVIAVCNTMGAQIPRAADATLYTRAGPEIGVASTKAFLAQLAAGYVLALGLAQARGTLPAAELQRQVDALSLMPEAVADCVGRMDAVRRLGADVADARAVLFLGRHVGYPVALEGALKLKELAYMHAEGFAAGELKHGPMALVEEGLPVVVLAPSQRSSPLLHAKMMSNIEEVRARGARTVVIAEDGDDVDAVADRVIRIPAVPPMFQPLVATVPLQVLAVEVARARGFNIDMPRNLAKSVTVE